MKLIKFETVATDAIVANTGFIVNVDVDNLEINIGATGTTTTMIGPFGTVTFTVDGTNAAEKLLNTEKIAVYLADKIALFSSGKAKGIFEFFRGGTIANFETDTGIVHTGSTNPLVSLALT